MNRLRHIFGQNPSDDDGQNPEDEFLEDDLSDEDELADTIDDVRQLMAEDPLATPLPGVMPSLQNAPLGATHRLPNLDNVLLRPVQRITFGYGRDIGMVRGNNEDSIFTFYASQGNVNDIPDFGVFIVADGAGGHANGEQASLLASRMLANAVNKGIYQPLMMDPLDDHADDLPPVAEVLTEAMKAADQGIRDSVPGSGTTMTAAVIIGDLAHIAHIGDSRAYLFSIDTDTRDPYLEQLTRDHSVAKRLEEIGQITAEEAAHHPEAGRLWKIMGLTENLEPDVITRRLPPDSRMLLCSDGLWNMVPQEEVLAILATVEDVQETADRLVAAANAHGGADNISAIVLDIPG